jgi:hypothetical protein
MSVEYGGGFTKLLLCYFSGKYYFRERRAETPRGGVTQDGYFSEGLKLKLVLFGNARMFIFLKSFMPCQVSVNFLVVSRELLILKMLT